MLEAIDISYAIAGSELLSGVSLDISPGEVVVAAGPNGAGKSTLLRILSGEQLPSRGSVLLDGVALSQYGAAQLACRRAVVPQASQLQFPFCVSEVVSLGISVPGFGHDDAASRHHVASAMGRADVVHLAQRLYPTLSGGERQRVHLARALCQLSAAPRHKGTYALFLDEPTASLDLAHQLLILEEARKEASRGLAVIVVLHDLNLAARYANRIVLLDRGRLVAFGRPEDVLQDDLLSEVFCCKVHVGVLPREPLPFLLPQACDLGPDRGGTRVPTG